MVQYLVHYAGAGEGCDYTIGCNHAVAFIGAKDLPDAVGTVVDKLMSYPEGEDSYYDPDALDKVTIYEMANQAIVDLEQVRQVRREVEAAEARTRRDQAERAQYERLKLRYG